MTNLTEIPSDYSNLIGRMQAVYKQFQTNETDMVSGIDINAVFGPLAKNAIQNRRMLVVDDQVFNIEFLRCQIELIPSM